MSESNKRSFWSTIPGLVTGLAGLLTGIVGLVTVLIQLGVVGGDDSTSPAGPTAVSGGTPSTAGGGTGVTSTTEAPRFTVSALTLDFPAGTREKTLQVKNISATATLTLSAPTVTGKDAAQFTPSLNTCGSPVRANLSCEIKVAFNPSGGLRSYEALLQLTAPGARGEEVRLTATTIL